MDGLNRLKIANDQRRIVRKFGVLLGFLCGLLCSVNAQSINQSFPTAITANEISGQIAARDIGDARLTNHFYTFNATQGDVFINVTTTNLNGDIDIFTADNLRPLSKITIYADAGGETGRVVYLRQPAKLLLRIEGRTPNDNAAIYRIKFAGSFAPAETVAEDTGSTTPRVKSDNQTDVRVNSVGTIIEIKPKPIPPAKTEAIADKKTGEKTGAPSEEKLEVNAVADSKQAGEQAESATDKSRTTNTKDDTETVAVNNEKPKRKTLEIENQKEVLPERSIEAHEPIKPAKEKTVAGEKVVKKSAAPKSGKKSKTVKPLPANALENIRLVILFKNGKKIESPMSDVLKVGVDRGVLTVITKDGQIDRYSILDIEKMTIE